jgi:inner membrane protein
MASLGHVAIGMACGRAFSSDRAAARKAAWIFTGVSLWPDLDAAGFLFGISYRAWIGHRGATHSLVVALLIGLAGYAIAQRRNLPLRRTTILTTIAATSHALLDIVTFGGGLGCALLWPISDERFWAPIRFIPISPIGLRIFSPYGMRVLLTEAAIFAPLFIYALWPRRAAAEPE